MLNILQKEAGKKIFYGWYIVLACFGINAVIHGIRYSYGVFFKSLSGEFDLSRAATAGISSAYWILCAGFGFLGGILMDKVGPRKLILPMGIVTGLSLAATSQANSTWQLFLSYSLLLSAGTGAVYSILMTLAQRWFHKKRGTAVGIVSAGVGVGTLIMTPLIAWLISHYEWRTTFLLMGIVLGLMIIGLSFFLKRDPAEIGLQPDGESAVQNTAAVKNQNTNAGETLSRAIRSRNFWLIAVIWFLWSFSLLLVLTHLVPHLTDIGIKSTTAALVGGMIGAVSIAGRLSVGWLSDRIGRKTSILLTVFLQAASLFLLAWSNELWLFYLFAIVYGLGYGGLDPATVALIGDIFGTRYLGRITGLLVFFWALGAGAGSAAGGLIYDAADSYFPAFVMIAGLMLLAAVLSLMIKKGRSK
ncbi:MAG TPA: MFS transporter [Dehalococcoidales bacterium]|nr:MFS transporter [Dehalococcoidales bacterium]